MGLTMKSVGPALLKNNPHIRKAASDSFVVALAGNPNVGKSTVFNALTGMNQHTGNWPGKTVTYASGICRYKNRPFTVIDLPGTYSLLANSTEEEIARDFICFGEPDVTVVVADATCLERNLNLVLQILEITNKVVVCVNLMDEARRKKVSVDIKKLSGILGVPVVGTNARKGDGLDTLMDAVHDVAVGGRAASKTPVTYNHAIEEAVAYLEPMIEEAAMGRINPRWAALRLLEGEKDIVSSIGKYLGTGQPGESLFENIYKEAIRMAETPGLNTKKTGDDIVAGIIRKAENISSKTVCFHNRSYDRFDRAVDAVLTSRLYGIPVMAGLLGLVFWLTITGANYPSAVLASAFGKAEEFLSSLFISSGVAGWIHGILVEGVFRTLAWVVSVMLPPMAIFFPLFTLLEDIGYLPRVAFNLDNFFKKACAHGKQALTMCMGFGCNAAGVIGCRIIDSPRERLIAIMTNTFVPCNGRFPMLIAISSIFIGGAVVSGSLSSLCSTFAVVAVVLAGIAMTLAVSWTLSHTVLKGIPSSFTLELPPFRKPQVGKIIIRSILDRTIFVLARAVVIAAPAGIIIWIMANIPSGQTSLLAYCASFLDPFAKLIGMDGYILMAFILGLPANEIVLPIIIMSYTAAGSMIELNSLPALYNLLVANGWTWLTAVCVMLFSLMHFPCGTTLWTIKKETGSLKWTIVSFVVPLAAGILCCFILAQLVKLVGL